MTTLRDVARHAGVSVSVVSAVINDSPHVRMSHSTRNRVLETIRELRYVPNHAARTLRMSRSGVAAVVVPEMSNPIFEEMVRGIHEAAESAGYVVLLGDAGWVQPDSDLLARLTGQGRVDGFLIRPSGTLNDEMIDQLAARGVPLVLLDGRRGGRKGSVALDDAAGTYAATTHLIELGHRDIGYLGGGTVGYANRRRETGYRTALRDSGIRRRHDWTHRLGFEPARGAQALRALMETDKRPTAAVVNNVTTALGVLAAAHDLGLAIPGDLSVVAIQDVPTAEYQRPALTCVRMPMYQLGYQGMEMLVRVLGGAPGQDTVITAPPPELVVRDSTAPPS